MHPVHSGTMRAHCVRFHPGDDFVPSMLEAVRQIGGSHVACFVLTCVGSLDQVTLRMANASSTTTSDINTINSNSNNNDAIDHTASTPNDIKTWNERFEIVSLVGTLTSDAKHLHLGIADKNGNAFGGHLISGRVFTTVELVLGTVDGVVFTREHDPATGYQELCIVSSNTNDDTTHRCNIPKEIT